MTTGQPGEPTASAVCDLLTTTWSELLEEETVGADDDVFELGAHSLLVGRVVAAVRQRLGVEIAFAAFFEYPTSRALADHVVASAGRS